MENIRELYKKLEQEYPNLSIEFNEENWQIIIIKDKIKIIVNSRNEILVVYNENEIFENINFREENSLTQNTLDDVKVKSIHEKIYSVIQKYLNMNKKDIFMIRVKQTIRNINILSWFLLVLTLLPNCPLIGKIVFWFIIIFIEYMARETREQNNKSKIKNVLGNRKFSNKSQVITLPGDCDLLDELNKRYSFKNLVNKIDDIKTYLDRYPEKLKDYLEYQNMTVIALPGRIDFENINEEKYNKYYLEPYRKNDYSNRISLTIFKMEDKYVLTESEEEFGEKEEIELSEILSYDVFPYQICEKNLEEIMDNITLNTVDILYEIFKKSKLATNQQENSTDRYIMLEEIDVKSPVIADGETTYGKVMCHLKVNQIKRINNNEEILEFLNNIIRNLSKDEIRLEQIEEKNIKSAYLVGGQLITILQGNKNYYAFGIYYREQKNK